jgi:phage terminase large subunit-like protein
VPKKDDQPTAQEFLRDIALGLKRAARSPNILGYVPHEKQVPFHAHQEQGRLFIGGNRSGKTVAGICEDVFWLTGKHPYRVTPPPPIRGRIVGVDFDHGVEMILRPELAKWMPLSELKGGSWDTAYSKQLRTLTLENDSFVEFMSYDQDLDKFAGTSRHFVHFDEEPPEGIYYENLARLIDTGGSWWMTMTPVEGMTWIYDKVYIPGKHDPASNIGVVEVRMDENPHLNPGEIQNYLSKLDKDEREARGKGKFVQIGGLVFKTFDEEKHVIDPMVPSKDWEWYASVDHGFNAPTAWLWHAVSPEGVVVTFAEHYEAEKTVDYHASIVHMRNAGFGRVPDMYVCDPALAQRQGVTGTSISQEYSRHGIPVIPGNNDVLAGVNRINQYLHLTDGKPRWYITRNCINLIREMKRLRWKTWASKKMASQNNVHDAIHKKDDHAPDSARYFFTFLPDLSNQLPTSQPQGLIIPPGFSSSVPQIDQRVDQLLIPAVSEENQEVKWAKEYMDESVGGVW